MSEMVERVAKAICKADDVDPNKLMSIPSAPEVDWPMWTAYERQAIAAIEAMREYGHEVGARRMWQELFPPPPEMTS